MKIKVFKKIIIKKDGGRGRGKRVGGKGVGRENLIIIKKTMSHTITSPLDNGLGLFTSYDTRK